MARPFKSRSQPTLLVSLTGSEFLCQNENLSPSTIVISGGGWKVFLAGCRDLRALAQVAGCLISTFLIGVEMSFSLLTMIAERFPLLNSQRYIATMTRPTHRRGAK